MADDRDRCDNYRPSCTGFSTLDRLSAIFH